MSNYTVYEYRKAGLSSKEWKRQPIAEGTNLKTVLAATRKYVARAWTTRPKIEVRVNGISPWKTTAAYLYAHPYKVLTHNFQYEIRIERQV